MIEVFELKRQGYYKQAIEAYYKLLSETDDNVEILVELADLYFLMKNNSKAMHYVEKVLELNPKHVQALEILKKVYIAQLDFVSAVDVAKKILEIDGSSYSILDYFELLFSQNKFEDICNFESDNLSDECLLVKAKAMYKMQRYDDAMRILENYKGKFSEQELLLSGKIYLKKGLLDKVKEVYNKLKDLELKDAESFNFVGLSYIDEMQLDKAVECFKKSIQMNENEAKFYYNLGQAYFLKGWIDEAKDSFNKAICLNPMEENYHYSLAYLLYRTGDYENALMHLDSDVADTLNSKILKLVIQSEKGDLATPKIELEKMLNDNPKNETILFSLAKIYFKLDMFKQAKTIMEDVLKLNDKSFEYQEFYVRLLLNLKELPSAKSKIDELVEKYPNYYYAKVLEAEYYMLSGEYDDLFETAQELIELEMNHYEGYYYNAVALFEKEDVNFAIESLKKAITLDVNNASLYVKMGEFYQALGKYEDAFEYIKEASDIDKSAKNKELYMQLSAIVRNRNLS